jgi:hypothetical protein
MRQNAIFQMMNHEKFLALYSGKYSIWIVQNSYIVKAIQLKYLFYVDFII